MRRVTKLYVKGACVSTRNNNFEISSAFGDINCGNKTNDATATTCMDVIENGARRLLCSADDHCTVGC